MYRIIENFLPENMLKELQRISYSSESLSYTFIPRIALDSTNVGLNAPYKTSRLSQNVIVDTPIFTSLIYSLSKDNVKQSDENCSLHMNPAYNLFVPFLSFMETRNLPVKRLMRIKMNCQHPHPNHEKHNHHPAHVDWWNYTTEFPNSTELLQNYTMVYYPFDTDGNFRIFENDLSEGPNNLKLHVEIEPKENRAILISSDRYHAGSAPIQYSIRHSLNIIFSSFSDLI